MKSTLRVLICLLAGCSEVPKGGVDRTGGPSGDPAAMLRDAEAAFAKDPRSWEEVERSLDLCERLAGADPKNVEALWRGARAGAWLSQFDMDPSKKKPYALRALKLANSAVAAAPGRADCRYYRALAVGFLAQADSDYGLDAMKEMEAEAKKAAELDPAVDRAGPWRFLGNFYRETPGPPTGPGSIRKSLQCFEKAEAIVPGEPENALYHGRSLRAKGDLEAARAKWQNVLAAPPVPGKTTEQAAWRTEARRELDRP